MLRENTYAGTPAKQLRLSRDPSSAYRARTFQRNSNLKCDVHRAQKEELLSHKHSTLRPADFYPQLSSSRHFSFRGTSGTNLGNVVISYLLEPTQKGKPVSHTGNLSNNFQDPDIGKQMAHVSPSALSY